jgi:patatin-like phospholipase/acyl hydrolase
MSVPFRKLGLSGGGIKGVLHLGALLELQKHQKLEFPDGIYGCSIGAVVATVIALNIPINEEMVNVVKTTFDFERVTPEFTFQDIFAAFTKKGVFEMTKFEDAILEFFSLVGVDIRSKKIGDADQPLFIIGSNITKGVPTIFTKDVYILDALKCSCCIPLMFVPQELYGQLYVDGGIFVPSLSILFKDGLHLYLTKTKYKQITPLTIETITPIDFLRQLLTSSEAQSHNFHKTEDTLELEYPKLMYNSDLNEFDVDDIIRHSQTLMRLFLVSKGFLQELAEVSNVGLT